MDMMASSNSNDDDDEHSTIGQMAKLLTESNTMTSSSTFDQASEVSTDIATAATSESDMANNESTTISTPSKSDTFLDATKNSLPDADRMRMSLSSDDKSQSGEITIKNVKSMDANNGADSITTEEAPVNIQEKAKSSVKSSTSSANPVRVSDRSRVVSKNDIESIRGRALNLTGSERRQSMPSAAGGGLIYVTAPPHSPPFDASANGPTMIMPKSAKAKIFTDDLSDVSMENDGMDLHSSEHMAMVKMMTTKASSMKATTTTAPPTDHDPQCKSKVR